MNRQEAETIREIVSSLMLLIHNERELAVAIAKHHNAPKYLYEQSANMNDHIWDLLQDL